MFFAIGIVAALATAAPTPVASPVPEASPLRVISVTTAERKDTPLSKTAQTTYVVDRAKIEASGYQTIAEAIRNVPGVTYFQYGGFGTQANIGTLGSNRSIVLLDGLPITAGSTGSVDLGTLTSADVDRIEIVESGGSTLYGSGGAGGVINIVTSVPRSTYLLLSYGSFGDRDVRVSTGNGTVGVSLERHVATNDYPYAAQDGFPAGTRVNAQALQSDASLDYQQKFDNFDIRANVRFSKLDLGVPGNIGPYGFTSDEFEASNRNDLNAKISHVDGKFTTSLQVAGFREALFDTNDAPADAVIDSRTNAALEGVVRESDRDALVAGIDLSRESLLDILGPFGPPDSFAGAQSQSALYAQQAFGIGPSGKIYAGLRAENDSPAGGILEPAGGFVFPVGAVRIAGNAASSFIVPTLFDLYYPGFSNPNLLPERDRNLNVVISSDQTFVRPTLTIFDRTANNLITNDANFTPVNAGQAHFQGGILSFAPRLFRTLNTQFSITDLTTATQVSNGVVGRIDYEPILQGTISIDHPFGQGPFAYGLSGRFAGAHTESFTGPGTYGQYSVFDVYGRAKLAPWTILTARVTDFGDEHYGMFSAYPGPARAYRVEFSTR